jgi:nitrogen-specific signal transduction histidine kinase
MKPSPWKDEAPNEPWADAATGRGAAEMDQSLREAARLETFGQLAVGVSHDFKNLLQIIVGNLYLLESVVAEDPAALKRLQTARRAANRGSQLIERLLALARPPGETTEVVDVAEVVGSLKLLLERSLGRQTAFEAEIPMESLAVKADAGQLESALVNLVINARDAMPAGGRIRMTARETSLDKVAATERKLVPGDYVEICVSDTGEGIPAELLERILEPFFTTKAQGKGSGLGLPMVQAFARSSGGKLEIQSETGRGTTVRIILPKAEGQSARSLNETALLPNLTKRRGRVIVAEPDSDVRHALQGILKTLGFETIPVAGLAELPVALRKSRDAKYLLIDEQFVASAAAAERVLTTIGKAAPELKTIWLGTLDGGYKSTRVSTLSKPVTRSSLTKVLDIET